jgi:hypothetical protein
MVMPNFLIIGAQKAGTTSLYYYLQQHPQIYMSAVKEPRFFYPEFYSADKLRPCKRKIPLSIEEYESLFVEVSNEIAIGEASTDYLHNPITPQRIKKTIPDVKLIAILRNPVERAFSAFCYQTRDGYETLNFADALREEEREKSLRDYKKLGFYYSQVKRYFDIFDRDKIKIYLTEDLYNNPTVVLNDIYNFLGVEQPFQPELSKKNESGIPKSRFIHDIFLKDNPIKSAIKPLFSLKVRKLIQGKVKEINLAAKPTLSLELRQNLIEIYREDIVKLETLIQKDLSGWLV